MNQGQRVALLVGLSMLAMFTLMVLAGAVAGYVARRKPASGVVVRVVEVEGSRSAPDARGSK